MCVPDIETSYQKTAAEENPLMPINGFLFSYWNHMVQNSYITMQLLMQLYKNHGCFDKMSCLTSDSLVATLTRFYKLQVLCRPLILIQLWRAPAHQWLNASCMEVWKKEANIWKYSMWLSFECYGSNISQGFEKCKLFLVTIKSKLAWVPQDCTRQKNHLKSVQIQDWTFCHSMIGKITFNSGQLLKQ